MTVVCILYAKCWSCLFGGHLDPSQPHTWMDEDEYEDSLGSSKTGSVTSETDLARERPCACSCAQDQGGAR